MITRDQVAGLQPGDVVEAHRPDWAEGTVLRGPLTRTDDGLWVADLLVQWSGSGDKRIAWMLEDGASLAVISRAPRPLYVNHPRTEPVPGDVACDAVTDDRDPAFVWCYLGKPGLASWCDRWGYTLNQSDLSDRLRLLVDGETGMTVPS